jgi:hypothetical protein
MHTFEAKDVLFAAKEVRKASYKHSGCTGAMPASPSGRDECSDRHVTRIV